MPNTGRISPLGREPSDVLGPALGSGEYAPPVRSAPAPAARPHVAGKFLAIGDEKFPLRGVTYGTFRPGADGAEYPRPAQVARDFAGMAAHGLNTVRVYTVPPRWVLDCALDHGLRVMVGLPWEQHVAFLDQPGLAAGIERRVREGVRACAGHSAVLCYAVGNEIPSPVVRWSGRRATERFLERLYRACKAEDPDALVTYVNYPSTEYVVLPFVDFVCFNVYLERRDRLEAYLARLQNLAGDRPLVLAELGLDSRRNGEARQAEVLDWQLRLALAGGCAGRVRVQLDRRVAPRRARRRRLGLRASSTASAARSPRSRPWPTRSGAPLTYPTRPGPT
jgi:hypothetical protein